MSRATFLDELSGDLVRHLRSPVAISGLVGAAQDARIFPESARFGSAMPQIVYTQADGHTPKILTGPDGCEELTLHIYCYSSSQPQSRALARSVHDACIGANNSIWGQDTIVHLCNGGIVDTGRDAATDHSDQKYFWTRLVLRLIISDA